MRPVDQTIFGFEEGNCFAACIASIFELPIEQVPNFCAEKDGIKWYDALDAWLQEHYRLSCLTFNYADPEDCWYPRGYSILSGVPPRAENGEMHSTVAFDGRMVFDPHPDRAGLTTPHLYVVFHATDPTKVAPKVGPDV